MKARIKNYFSLTKKEWNGMVVLVILIVLIVLSPYAYQLFHKDTIIDFKGLDTDAAALARAKGIDTSYDEPAAAASPNANQALFDFNPNKLPAGKWKQLGLGDKQIAIIQHFEARGGHFNSKQDVQKLYCLSAADYKRLEPYIDIPTGEVHAAKLKPGETIELNNADSATLTKVKGIGPSFAMRIIRYRGRLGGFVAREQLKEVYGVDTAKFSELKGQLTVNPLAITKIKVNSISFAALQQFPYLNYKQASAVIEYRAQHGNYTSMDDLKNIAIINTETLRKIVPYISFK